MKKIKNLILEDKFDETIDRKLGYKFLKSIAFNQNLKNELNNYINKKKLLNVKEFSEKKFLLNILDNNEINSLQNLIQFSLSKEIIYMATNYLNDLPFLSHIHICITPPNDTIESSQLYHLDTEAKKNVKFFFLLNDVDENNGPFTFIDKLNSKKIIKITNYDGKRLNDDEIKNSEKNYENYEKKFIGKYGSGLAIDTANCLHYGSRKNIKDRVILILYFTTHFTSHYENHDLFKKIEKSKLNEIQKNIVSHFNGEIFRDKNFFKRKKNI